MRNYLTNTDNIITERDNIQKKLDIAGYSDNIVIIVVRLISDGENVIELMAQLNEFKTNMTNTMKDEILIMASEAEARIKLEC